MEPIGWALSSGRCPASSPQPGGGVPQPGQGGRRGARPRCRSGSAGTGPARPPGGKATPPGFLEPPPNTAAVAAASAPARSASRSTTRHRRPGSQRCAIARAARSGSAAPCAWRARLVGGLAGQRAGSPLPRRVPVLLFGPGGAVPHRRPLRIAHVRGVLGPALWPVGRVPQSVGEAVTPARGRTGPGNRGHATHFDNRSLASRRTRQPRATKRPFLHVPTSAKSPDPGCGSHQTEHTNGWRTAGQSQEAPRLPTWSPSLKPAV
jgi:hypothetical protein